ncbi:MAG: hypothetical protein LBD20_08865 [Spirochaetaceae bacterium]|nr:hypothetical protein [Spirochaetaceae bacterium]
MVDVPKIRTVTSFGETLVLANGAYIDAVSNVRIWLYEKLIDLLEARLLCFSDILKNNISKNDTGSTASVPAWYAEGIGGYWDIAGFPRTISGAFFTGSGSAAAPPLQIPAVLSLSPIQPEHGVTGWNLTIGGSSTFIFIDPKNAPQTIYKRRGKSPADSTVKINAALYVNPAATSPREQYIALNCFGQPHRSNKKGIDVTITYDGEIFEIRESPPRSRTVLFRGKRTVRQAR